MGKQRELQRQTMFKHRYSVFDAVRTGLPNDFASNLKDRDFCYRNFKDLAGGRSGGAGTDAVGSYSYTMAGIIHSKKLGEPGENGVRPIVRDKSTMFRHPCLMLVRILIEFYVGFLCANRFRSCMLQCTRVKLP